MRKKTQIKLKKSIVDKGEGLTQGMDSSLRMNKHIRFSITFSSSSSANDTIHRGLTPLVGNTTEPMIQ